MFGIKTRSEGSWSALTKSLRERQVIRTCSNQNVSMTECNYFFVNGNDVYYISAVILEGSQRDGKNRPNQSKIREDNKFENI